MSFVNPTLLFGLLAIGAPVLLHLLRQRSARRQHWGAMRFLEESVQSRSRRIGFEDATLLAARCLLVGLVVFALARPIAAPTSLVPWTVVLPGALAAIAAFGVGVALWNKRRFRLAALTVAGALSLAVLLALLFERSWNLKRFGGGGDQDVVVIIDASTSMRALDTGRSRFDLALEEARQIIQDSSDTTRFSIVLAGGAPLPLTTTPTASREDLAQAIDAARPSDCSMSLVAALREASSQLSRSGRANGRVVLLTDGRAHGWETEDSAAWGSVRDAFGKGFARRPQFILRRIAPGQELRNLAVVGISCERRSIGTDRPVEVRVELENTGSEAVTPSAIQLRVGEELLEDRSHGQLIPGERRSSRFMHRFDSVGSHPVTARIRVEDQIEADDVASRVLEVTAGIEVLLVEGNPGRRETERASFYLQTALAPGLSAGEPSLIRPTVISASELAQEPDLKRYAVVVLADVPRLPAAAADSITGWVRAGGGLLVAPGKGADREFYNGWRNPSGAPLLPGLLEVFATPPSNAQPHPSVSTLNPQRLGRALRETGDLGEVVVGDYWRLGATNTYDNAGETIAGLDNGDPLFRAQPFGRGRVILSSVSFDSAATNLVAKVSFVPLAHVLIDSLTIRRGDLPNLNPRGELVLRIPNKEVTPIDQLGVLDPRGEARVAKLATEASNLVASVQGEPVAGLYEMEIPERWRKPLASHLSPAGTLPFSLARAPDESGLIALQPDDLNSLARFCRWVDVRDAEGVLTLLSGESYGRELWRPLALAALLLLIGEIALGRWISRARHLGSSEGVEFIARRPSRAQAHGRSLGSSRGRAA